MPTTINIQVNFNAQITSFNPKSRLQVIWMTPPDPIEKTTDWSTLLKEGLFYFIYIYIRL